MLIALQLVELGISQMLIDSENPKFNWSTYLLKDWPKLSSGNKLLKPAKTSMIRSLLSKLLNKFILVLHISFKARYIFLFGIFFLSTPSINLVMILGIVK